MPIKDGELIHFNPLEEEIDVQLIEDELEREQAKTIGYYAMFEYHTGYRKAIYWSIRKMMAHADKYSAAFSAEMYEKKYKMVKSLKKICGDILHFGIRILMIWL